MPKKIKDSPARTARKCTIALLLLAALLCQGCLYLYAYRAWQKTENLPGTPGLIAPAPGKE